MTWHLHRLVELDAILDAAETADYDLDVTELDLDQAAAAILARADAADNEPRDR